MCLSRLLFLVFIGDLLDGIAARIIQSPILHYEQPNCAGKDCYPELNSRLYQGDILLPEGVDPKNALKIEPLLWPNGVVPYAFAKGFNKGDKSKILSAMRLIEMETCITFLPRTILDRTWIDIEQKKEAGCYSIIGYRPLPHEGPLKFNLRAPECYEAGTIQHELLHVLGLLHEQARPDRDEFVDILWDNIDEAYHSDFTKASDTFVTTYDIPYDYDSVMHYPKWAFSKNDKSTIVAKNDTERELGQRIGATNGDFEKIRRMYKCQITSEDLFGGNFPLNKLFL
ncbi:Astacin (Peptidase family M12A) [Nesidiocoris tenuis]|uniref:Metalloendopeptidase n=1 Tax=Nesidiocoris tenuis TaxID=355587 RepID=A0ABN7B2D6_9HEMI|nr:Astacin (Peptidase family M12A) [Nesidiocoris tenuis]